VLEVFEFNKEKYLSLKKKHHEVCGGGVVSKANFTELQKMIDDKEVDYIHEYELQRAVKFLNKYGYETRIEDFQGWGRIVRFIYKGHEVFARSLTGDGQYSLAMTVYYYTGDYSVDTCYSFRNYMAGLEE
jgi:hypothetical protein